MVKNISIFLLGIFAVMCFFWAFKGCESKPSNLSEKLNSSLLELEIQKKLTEKVNKKIDSLVKIQYKKDSIAQIKTKSLTSERNRLLAIVRGFTNIRIDSISQTVNNIPIAVYEAEMNANAICDTLLNFKDEQISIRDSVIFLRELELKSCENMNQANEQALQDLIALNHQEKRKLKRAKSLNKKIPLIGSICLGVGPFLAILALN